jgi:hypothetical protein
MMAKDALRFFGSFIRYGSLESMLISNITDKIVIKFPLKTNGVNTAKIPLGFIESQ